MAKRTQHTDHATGAPLLAIFQKPFKIGNLYRHQVNLPLFVYSLLHPTILVVAGYCTVQLNLPFAAKLLLLALACFASTWLIYLCISRPFVLPKVMFGPMQKSKKQGESISHSRHYNKRKAIKRTAL